MTITLEKTKGYEIGKNSGKTWLAKITRDGHEFVKPSDINYGDGRDWFRKNRATRFDTYEIVNNGLYEVCELGIRHYRVIFTKSDGTSSWCKVDSDRAKKMTKMLESGLDSEEARIATKPKKP